MNSPSSRIAFLPALLGALLLTAIPVIAQNELVPASNAVKLERVWTREGEPLTADEYGYNVWGGVDLSGDSIADFGVYRNSDNVWLFYAGGDPPDTIPFLVRDSLMSITPIVGDFIGDGGTSFGFMRARIEDPDSVPKVFYLPSLYWKTMEGFADMP